MQPRSREIDQPRTAIEDEPAFLGRSKHEKLSWS